MEPKHRELINSNSNYLKENISLRCLTPYLLESGIFTSVMLDDIFETNSVAEIMDNLLIELPTRGPNAYENFLNILEASGHEDIAAVLREEGTIELSMNGSIMKSATEAPIKHYEHSIPNFINDDVYKMNSHPLGLCLIINNVKFEGVKYRHGSDRDKDLLKVVFKNLGFKVNVESNLIAENMWKLLQNFAEKSEHSSMDSCVVIILSHGNRDCVYGIDENPVFMDSIVHLFNNENCPALREKPKLFFIQACRGKEIDIGTPGIESRDVAVFRDIDVSFSIDESRLPNCCDTLISYAAVEGYQAIRHHILGSWYCQELGRALIEEANYKDLLGILRSVERNVRKYISSDGEKQATELCLKGWVKKLYFIPDYSL